MPRATTGGYTARRTMTNRTAGSLAIGIGGVAAVALMLTLKYTSIGPRALLKAMLYASIALVWLGGIWRARSRAKRKDDDMPSPLRDLLLEKLHAAIGCRVDADPYGSDGSFARQVRELPRGLRAMAATHFLDLSLTLDDLGWHFLNFGEANHVEETEAGLRELGLGELADLFHEAYGVLGPHLAAIEQLEGEYEEYTEEAGIKPRLDELSEKAWELHGVRRNESAIYAAWCRYAQAHPEDSGFDRPWAEIEASLKHEHQDKAARLKARTDKVASRAKECYDALVQGPEKAVLVAGFRTGPGGEPGIRLWIMFAGAKDETDLDGIEGEPDHVRASLCLVTADGELHESDSGVEEVDDPSVFMLAEWELQDDEGEPLAEAEKVTFTYAGKDYTYDLAQCLM